MTNPQSPLDERERLIWTADIVAHLNLTDRALRNQIVRGKFPRPDGNFGGRNFWFKRTFDAWQADALAGKFKVTRRPAGQHHVETEVTPPAQAVDARRTTKRAKLAQRPAAA